jgi:hypothetical protein
MDYNFGMTMKDFDDFFSRYPFSMRHYRIIIRSRGKRHALDAGDISIDHQRQEIYL